MVRSSGAATMLVSQDVTSVPDEYSGVEIPPLPPRYQSLVLPDDWFVRKAKTKTKKETSSIEKPNIPNFQDILKIISKRWKVVDAETLKFVKTVADRTKKRRDELKRSTGDGLLSSHADAWEAAADARCKQIKKQDANIKSTAADPHRSNEVIVAMPYQNHSRSASWPQPPSMASFNLSCQGFRGHASEAAVASCKQNKKQDANIESIAADRHRSNEETGGTLYQNHTLFTSLPPSMTYFSISCRGFQSPGGPQLNFISNNEPCSFIPEADISDCEIYAIWNKSK